MKNSRSAAPMATLALASLLTACTRVGGDLATDEEMAADHEVAPRTEWGMSTTLILLRKCSSPSWPKKNST